jgi:glycosyltransferase involved in cell wall biosynthesis
VRSGEIGFPAEQRSLDRNGGDRVLMIYVETAPYIVGLIAEIKSRWHGAVDVAFLHAALSQPWQYQLKQTGEVILPSERWRALRAIYRLLRHNDYRLIHLAGWGHPLLLATLLFGTWLGIAVAVETDTPLPPKMSLWKRLSKKVTYPLIFKLPKTFLPAGTRQAAYLRHYGVDDRHIRVARMTVDVEKIRLFSDSLQSQFKRDILRRYAIPDSHVRILYLGRLEPHKGLSDLFEAFGRLKQQMDRVVLLIAGDGSMQEWVKQQASPSTSIYYLGRLSNEQVWEAYAVSDIFVLPSHFEPWGLVINEAMASGLPVIVTDQAGCIDDLVRHEGTGLVVPAESPQKLFEAMQALAADATARQRMGAHAKRLIADWTLENSAKETVTAWTMALT